MAGPGRAHPGSEFGRPVRTRWHPRLQMLAASAWDVVTSVGTAVGGLGAAAGAIAAWKAATASRATSRDALEALAVAIEPSVFMDVNQEPREVGAPMPGPTRMSLNIRNSARWPASRVDVEMTLADGEVIRSSHELLDTMVADGDINLPIRDVTPEWPPHDLAEPLSVVIRYSDLREIARYEQSMTVGLVGGKLPNMGVQVQTSPPRWRRLR
jgi:hypothetical protein